MTDDEMTTETTTPSVPAAAVALVSVPVVALVAYLVLGGPPTVTTDPPTVVAFGAWLMRFGLVLAVLGLAFSLASAFGAGMAVTKKDKKGGAERLAVPATATAGAGLLKDLIGVTASLLAVPAGLGAFTMLVGAILIVGVVFAGGGG